MRISELLEILACPKCLNELKLLEDAGKPAGFVCHNCKLVYPIQDEIPIMLPELAVNLEAWEKGEREKVCKHS